MGHNEAMAYVAINVLSVPEGAGATLEERFGARKGAVDQAPGFEHFELLRPVEGTDQYLVYTRWTTREDFEAWQSSRAFDAGQSLAAEASTWMTPCSVTWTSPLCCHSVNTAVAVLEMIDGAPDPTLTVSVMAG